MSKSIAQIKEEFGKADEKEREALYSMYDADARSGVQKLIASYRKKEEALRLERERRSPKVAKTGIFIPHFQK